MRYVLRPPNRRNRSEKAKEKAKNTGKDDEMRKKEEEERKRAIFLGMLRHIGTDKLAKFLDKNEIGKRIICSDVVACIPVCRVFLIFFFEVFTPFNFRCIDIIIISQCIEIIFSKIQFICAVK